MKKSVITLFSALLVSSAVAVNANTVNAAKTNDGKNSTASITINPGDLSIAQADNIDFGTITLDGTTKSDIKPVKTDQSPDNPTITVNDYRGSNNKGWSLTAKLSTTDNNFANTGIDMKFTPSKGDNVKNVDTFSRTLSKDANLIAQVTDNNVKIQETSLQSLINLNPTLNVPSYARAGEFKATVVWSLTSDAVSSNTPS